MIIRLSLLFIGITFDLTYSADQPVVYYASKYDHIDVEAILNNKRMVNYYSSCLLSKGPCPPEGVEFKRILPEALITNCARCTEKQISVAYRSIKRLKKEYPKIWNELSTQWDPDDIYVKKFEATFGTNKFPNVNTNKRYDTAESPSSTNDKKLFTPSIPSSSTLRPTKSTLFTNKKSTVAGSSRSTSSTFTTATTPTSHSATIATTTAASTISSNINNKLPIIPGLIPLNTFFTNPPVPIRPLVNFNLKTNLGNTVSGFVKGLEAIGDRVVETGAEIAQVVFKKLAKPLDI